MSLTPLAASGNRRGVDQSGLEVAGGIERDRPCRRVVRELGRNRRAALLEHDRRAVQRSTGRRPREGGGHIRRRCHARGPARRRHGRHRERWWGTARRGVQAHRDGVRVPFGRGQVELAVAVQVGEVDGEGRLTDQEVHRWPERTRAVAEQDTDPVTAGVPGHAVAVARRVRRHHVGQAVSVHVADRDALRHGAGGVGLARRESAVPVSEQDGDRVRAGVGGDEIGLAVAVQVSGADRMGLAADRVVHRRLERAVTDAAENAGGAGEVVGDGEVGLPSPLKSWITIECGALPARIVDLRSESPVAVAEQHADRASSEARDGGVELAVGVQIADRDFVRVQARRILNGSSEGPAARSFQHADRARVLVRGHDVRLPVGIEIGDLRCLGLSGGAHREERSGLERAVAVALEDADVAGECVRAHEVELPVPADIGGDDRVWCRAALKRRRGTECRCGAHAAAAAAVAGAGDLGVGPVGMVVRDRVAAVRDDEP